MKNEKHYQKKTGKIYKGKTHLHNGLLMTGAKMSKNSKVLTHKKVKK
jgi:hypothetical protein